MEVGEEQEELPRQRQRLRLLSQSTVVPTPNNSVGTLPSPEMGDSDDGQQSEVGSHGEVPLEEATTESLCSGVSDAEDEFAEVPLPEVEVPVVEVTINWWRSLPGAHLG